MRILRHYATTTLLAAIIATPASTFAATIFEIRDNVTVFADSLQGKAGNFLDQNIPADLTNYISNSEIESVITDQNPATFAWSPDFHMSQTPLTYLDLGFSTDIYNGDGYDLTLFFTGNGTNFKDGSFAPFQFSLDVGADGSIELFDQGVTSSSTTFNNGAFAASYALIDLDSLGFDTVTPLGDIRIHMGERSMPTLSMAGAYYTSATMPPATVVPLPPSVWLFSTALAMLGVIARRTQV